MKTRFDNTLTWVAANNRVLLITDMETQHLLNVLTMFVNKPKVTISLIIHDLEHYAPWGVDRGTIAKSLNNITSMSFEQIAEYGVYSPLGKAITAELEQRGVNVLNYLDEIKGGMGQW